jgi:hypothetical protein
MSEYSIELENQGIGAEINQHPIVLEAKQSEKGLKDPILRSSRIIIEPTR